MNKLNYNNFVRDNKFGQYNHRHNFDTVTHHKQNDDVIKKLSGALHGTHHTEHSMKLKKILNEIVEKYSEPVETKIDDEPILDFTTIYNRKAEEVIQPIERKSSSNMPKMRAVVELAVSQAKLQAIIKAKKW